MSPGERLSARLRSAVADERVLAAIAQLPRERFVPAAQRDRAYDNVALPIACGQTISQPLVVARMLELLELTRTDRVLDVGTGSGYHAALLAMLAGEVWTIERHQELSEQAQRTITELDIDNVHFACGDGADGLAEHAPFDAINVAAAVGARVPTALERQLALGGRLVAPVGDTDQRLVRLIRTPTGCALQRLEPVRFVPLIRGHGGGQD
jgi:protein-L-isoaspartate(D-aspartate) O-methyltransferase